MGTPNVLAKLDHESVIERVAAGEYAAHIARELQVSKQALQYRLRTHPRYQEAREVGCELRIDKVMAELASLRLPDPPRMPVKAELSEIEHEILLEDYKSAFAEWKAEVARVEFDLARAEREWRTVAWQAEREFPTRWGQRTHVTVENVTDLADKLRRARERVIEHENPIESVDDLPPAVP